MTAVYPLGRQPDLIASRESESCECGLRSMGWAFSPAMHYVYADRWIAALTPRVFSGPLLDSLQWDDTTWSQCLIRHRRDARPATLSIPSGTTVCSPQLDRRQQNFSGCR